MPEGDRALLRAMHRGHEPSAEQLWCTYAPRLLAYARAVLPPGSACDAPDIVQAVFLAVLDCPRAQIKRVAEVEPWLFRIARNTALNHARAEHREHARRSGATPVTSEPTPDTDRLRAATDALPEPQREVILLKHAGGLTFDQVAASLGQSRSTIATRHRTAIETLRRAMNDDPTEVNHATT